MQYFIAPVLNVVPLLKSLVPQACNHGSKSKVGAIKCYKENKITAPPDDWRNIPLQYLNKQKFNLKENNVNKKLSVKLGFTYYNAMSKNKIFALQHDYLIVWIAEFALMTSSPQCH